MQLATVGVDDGKTFVPEMLRYTVDQVPCFVLLRPDGYAMSKSGPPTSYDQMATSLEEQLRRQGL